MIKIDFEFDAQPYGTFRDALHLPEDHGLSDTEIEALKQERFDNWMAIVNAPPSDEPVVEEVVTPPASIINIAGVEYALLEGAPLSGQTLIEVNSHWYYKV
jgi:hypothetical protein